MPARIESPWKRVLSWLLVLVIVAGAGVGGYWGIIHPLLHKPAPENKPDQGPKSDPVAVITPGKEGKDKDKGGPRDTDRQPPAVSRADEEDAALLPPDALAFAALRVTDLWNSEAGKQLQLRLEVSGEQYLPQAEQWLGVPFADIDRIIVFMPGLERALAVVGPVLESFGKQAPTADLGGPEDLFAPVVIVRTLRPYDRAAVRQRFPGGLERTHHGKPLVSTGPDKDALHFVSDRLYVRGWTKGVEAFLDLPRKQGTGLARQALNPAERKVGILFVNTGFYVPLLADVFRRHADELPGQVRANRASLEPLLGKEFVASLERDLVEKARRQPEQLAVDLAERLFDQLVEKQAFLAAFRPFFSTRSLALNTDISGVWQLDVTLHLFNESQAAARKALQAGRKPFRDYWQKGRDAVAAAAKDPQARARLSASLQQATAGMMGGSLKDPEQLLKVIDWFGEMVDKELVIDGTGITAHAGFRTRGENFVNAASLFIRASLEAAQAVRAAAVRTQSQNNLKMIGVAMHTYNDTHEKLPPPAIYGKDGKPLLSWRVALLPYIEEAALYKQFKLDEPWDSPHNIKLLDKMPWTYARPGEDKPTSLTYYQAFVGRGSVFEPGAAFKGMTLTAITQGDGTSFTLLVAEAAEPVPWTKPVDLPFSADKPLPKLGGIQPTVPVFSVLFADGSTLALPRTVSEKTLRALITPRGGEVIDVNELQPGKSPAKPPTKP